jgi:hypothetical protein
MLGTRTILGLAIDEFGIVAAEVSARSGRPEIRRVGQVTFDDKLSSDNMGDRAGQLKQFLRTNHFSSKQAVIGIPLKWVVAREMMAPAANADAVAGMLGIQAERAFSLNANELIFDYYGSTSTSESSRVMLLAARRQMIDQIKELAVAAGLHPQAVTISALAFSAAQSASGSEQHYGLYARPTYCEFWSQSNGRLQTIRHVPIASSNGSTPDPAELLSSAIQRQVMLTSQEDQSAPYEVTLYDASGLSSAVIEQLNKQLKPQITVTDGRSAFLSGGLAATDHSAQAQSVAAAAVAMTMASAAGPAVDFLNPRIGAKKVSSRRKAITWGVVGAAACVLAITLVVLDWHFKQRDIAQYTAKLESLQPQIDAAQKVVDRVTFAGPWLSQEPRFLECLRQLTPAFPQRPNSAWATNMSLNDKGGGSMSGKAVDKATALAVMAQIRTNPIFKEVNMNYLREAGKEGFEFSVNFQFKGGK